MTEEINYSYDGGLYAELVRNRSFRDDPAAPVHWSAVQPAGASVALALDPGQPFNAAVPASLRLDVSAASSEAPAGVANEGYFGVPVMPRTRYRAVFYAKAAPGFFGTLAVSLAGADGKTAYAAACVPKLTAAWVRYQVWLNTPDDLAPTANARLVLSVDRPGTIWFGFVSLFPPTWKDRPNGCRRDLMQMLIELRPKFLRFPGGNYLEGDTVATRFDWRRTLGPVEERPGHPCPWGYRSTDGMGLLEFLLWCEDMGAEPLLGVYAGYSLKGEVVEPGSDLAPFVQDALDEIEYVAGPTNTVWGARRAKDGHPAPFALRYVEIGNEDWFDKTRSYDARFAQFADAIKARYPALKCVSTVGNEQPDAKRVHSRRPDALDEHYYRRADDFLKDAPTHFEGYDRGGPEIFVGEWAAHETPFPPWDKRARAEPPTPNMAAALGDAAWMAAMERNSDVVSMQCYAPLFVNVNGRQWRPDLIGYDALRAYGSPSYYAFQMFSRRVGDEILRAAFDGAAPLQASVTRERADGTILVKLVNPSPAPQTLTLDIRGGSLLAPLASALTLAAPPEATNSIDQPRKVAPSASRVEGVASRFDYTVPPTSVVALYLSCRPSDKPAETAAATKAQPFALSDVRLLEGPFKDAQVRDEAYLMALDPDRLLHNFRVNAGLPSSAEPLGNWERPVSELRGHFTGHYLSACALMYASTGDVRFKARADSLVRELAQCQAALGPSGYLSAFPETFFDRLENGQNVWAPYYTLHKILAGVLDAHASCGNAQALEVASRLGDWVTLRTSLLSDAQLQRALDTEHGGINESMAELYARIGKAEYLRAARRLCHAKVFGPLAAREDKLSGIHANTQFPKIIGAARLYELTGEARYREIAEFFWDRVVNHHSYATGGNSDHEGFGPPDRLNDRVSPFTTESCNTYNMLKLTHHLFAWDADAAQADYCERALYNHILASQDPRTGCMAYHLPLYGGWFMPYDTTNVSCWCCTGTGIENHARYGEGIYFRDADGLFVNLFIPSELTWREKGVTVRLETRYPEEPTVRLTVKAEKTSVFALRVRCPAWVSEGMTFTVNGAPATCNERAGRYAMIAREWRDGDRVEWTIPMRLRLVPMPDNPTRAAVCYGPVVLAGELGATNMAPPRPYAVKQSDFFTKKETPPPMPVLLAGGKPVEEWLKPVPGQPLAFRTQGVGQPREIDFVAFYKMPPQRYSIYWDILAPAQW